MLIRAKLKGVEWNISGPNINACIETLKTIERQLPLEDLTALEMYQIEVIKETRDI